MTPHAHSRALVAQLRPPQSIDVLTAIAHAARLRMDDACRAGAELPDEDEFGRIEDAWVTARDNLRAAVRDRLGVRPDMLAAVL